MFTRLKTDEKLQEVIDALHVCLLNEAPGTDEYSKITDQLIKLKKLQAETSQKPISNDTLAVIAGNLAGILLILNYERAGIVTSKAMSFVMKAK